MQKNSQKKKYFAKMISNFKSHKIYKHFKIWFDSMQFCNDKNENVFKRLFPFSLPLEFLFYLQLYFKTNSWRANLVLSSVLDI